MKTILIVDDEYGIVEILRLLLQEVGYRVVSAANGEDGLIRLQTEKPDMVLVDYMMPIGDGRHFLRGMRALPEFANVPVVMMSAVEKQVALAPDEQGVRPEVAAYLRKPFDLKQLFRTIEGCIGK